MNIIKFDSKVNSLNLDNGLLSLNNPITNIPEDSEIVFDCNKYLLAKPIVFKDLHNVKINGNNSLFLNTAFNEFDEEYQPFVGVFRFENCTNIEICNIKIDYDKPLNITGKIIEVGNEYIDVELIDELASITGFELITTVDSFDEDFTPNIKLAHSTSSFYKTKKIASNVLRIYCPIQNATVGEMMYGSMKMKCASVFEMIECKEVYFHDIRIYSAPRMVFYISPSSKNYVFERVVCKVPEHSKRIISTNADVIHVGGIEGKIVIKDCEFIGLGDDAINVHSCAAKAISFIDENTVSVTDPYFHNVLPATWAKNGHMVSIFDKDTFIEKGRLTLKEFHVDKLIFNENCSFIKPGDFIANISCLPDVEITGCNFQIGRARGVLLQTNNVYITNNTIAHFALSGVLISTDFNYWYEMVPGKNINILNNKIIRTGIGDVPTVLGAINVKLNHDVLSINHQAGLFRDITIENNLIDGTLNNGIFVQSCKNLKINNNTIINYDYKKSNESYLGHAITVINSEEVEISDNQVNDNEINILNIPEK